MLTARELGRGLNRRESQRATLSSLIQLGSAGADLSVCAADVVRYVVKASRPDPALIPLALDVLTISPEHGEWDVIVETVAGMIAQGSGLRVAIISRTLAFPEHASRKLLPAFNTRERDGSYEIQPVVTALGFLLREIPLTQRAVSEEELQKTASSLQRVGGELLDAAVHSENDMIPALILSRLVDFIDRASRGSTGPASSTRRSLSAVLSVQLAEKRKSIAARAAKVSKQETTSTDKIVRALSVFSGYLLAQKTLVQIAVPADVLSDARDWAVSWITNVLAKQQTNSVLVAKTLLEVAGRVDRVSYKEQADGWYSMGISRLLDVLEGAPKLGGVRLNDVVTSTAFGLLELARRTGCSGKFLSSSVCRLLPFAFLVSNTNARFRGFQNSFRALVEFDLKSDHADNTTLTVAAFLSSKAVETVFAGAEKDSRLPSEFVACISLVAVQVCPNIAEESNLAVRWQFAERWAEIASKLVLRLASCLSWNDSPTLLLAAEGYLKVFEAFGQYTISAGGERSTCLESFEKAQEILVRMSLSAKTGFVRSALLLINTRYWIESGLKAEANAGHILKAAWAHLQGSYSDSAQAVELAKVGRAWSASSSKIGRFDSLNLESALIGSVTAMELTRRIPRAAEKVCPLLLQYLNILDKSQSYNVATQMTVEAAYFGCLVYMDEHNPSPRAQSSAWPCGDTERLSWLFHVRDACVLAGSRSGWVATDQVEAQIEQRMLQSTSNRRKAFKESDNQRLTGSSDPVTISATHCVDREKGIVHFTIVLQNKSAFTIEDAYMEWRFGSSLQPLPGAASGRSVGKMSSHDAKTASASALVQPERSGIGKLTVSVRVGTVKDGGPVSTYDSLAYTVPASDILLLGPPSADAGLNVFRRRWDYLTSEQRCVVYLSSKQTVDLLVDILERRSPLAVAGRMNGHAQVVAMMSDSSISKHATLLMHVPETESRAGLGPATAFMSVRTGLNEHGLSLMEEIQLWLRVGGFKSETIGTETGPAEPGKSRFIRPQSGGGTLQRWRKVQRVRLAL